MYENFGKILKIWNICVENKNEATLRRVWKRFGRTSGEFNEILRIS